MKAALKIALIYIAFGAFWILFSDRVVLWFLDSSEIQSITYFQSMKGLFYVLLTGVLLYFLVNHYIKTLDKRLQEEEHLNQLLIVKSKELENTNKDLEGFVFRASKDLLEPLRMITNFLNLFKSKYFVGLDEKGKSYITFAHEGALNMRTTLFDFLDYSTVTSSPSVSQDVDLNEVLKVILDKLVRKIEEKEAMIHVEALPVVYGDRESFVRVFLNLLDNALKFTKYCVKPKIKIGYRTEEGLLKFYVKDNGIGIPSEYLVEVFHVFRRLTNNQKFQGSGMGLPIVKKIIENKGGTCWIESKEGEGTTVFFTLPVGEKR